MIINVGQRTDIPAFYSDWFYRRIKEGFVQVRNPFYPKLVTEYRLDPEVVDILSFCTKNPAPMLSRLDELKQFRQWWYVSITPYGKDLEAGVPDKRQVIESFKNFRTRSAATTSDGVMTRSLFMANTRSLIIFGHSRRWLLC